MIRFIYSLAVQLFCIFGLRFRQGLFRAQLAAMPSHQHGFAGKALDLRNARETLLCASWTAACMTAFALWTQASGNVLNRAKQEERPNADY